MKNANANNARDARQTYQARANDVARLIDVLQMELDKHATAAKADARCWGKVGDLGKVRGDLIELVAFMSNVAPDQIEAFLAE